MRLARAVALTLCVFLAACSERPTGPEMGEPVAAISDGANEGNDHFFFLPPMVPDPIVSGTFDGSQEPWIEICVWEGSSCGAGLEIYNMATGPGSETIRVNATDEHYIVNWHSDETLERFPLGPGESYRIRVLVGAQLLGYADVEVVDNGKQLKNVETDEYIPLLDGRTLPIKFRIEEGFDSGEGGGEMVTSGYIHSCAVDTNGDAYCWGHNAYGKLGTGYFSPRENTPQLVTGGHTFKSVSTGRDHTCGVTTSGDAYCWGNNFHGQLGIGSISYPFAEATPMLVTGGHSFESVSAGRYHSCGVTTAGDAYCWGGNYDGQLGTGSISYKNPTPLLVTGSLTFEALSIGLDHTCGLTTAGVGYCWGNNFYGQVGDGTNGSTNSQRPSPTLILGGHTFQSLDAGQYHSCGLTTNSDAYCWGSNFNGQLGTGFTSLWENSPQLVTGGHSFESVSAGGFHSCAVTNSGAAYCWGQNLNGQLGTGFVSSYPYYWETTPMLVTGGQTFQWVSAGAYHTCGTTTSLDAYCWGANGSGQLGDGAFTEQSAPVFAFDLDPVIS